MADVRFSFVRIKEVAEARENRVPLSTKRHTLWSGNVYEQWAEAMNNEFRDFRQENEEFICVPSIEHVTVKEQGPVV